jgi:hypothetical protein
MARCIKTDSKGDFWEVDDETGKTYGRVDAPPAHDMAGLAGSSTPPIYKRPDGLRYEPNLLMDMPRGRQPKPADMNAPPQVTTVEGPALAHTLMFAQFPLDPNRLSAKKPSASTKLNSVQRRAAKIAAEKLYVDNGKLCGF